MTLVLTISAKESSKGVNVNKQRFFINKEEENLDFLTRKLRKEVMDGTKSEQIKKLKTLQKIQIRWLLILGGMATIIPKRISAQTEVDQTDIKEEMAILNDSIALTPNLVMEWGLKVAMMAVAIGVAISGALLAMAGVFRMIRKRQEA